MSENPDEPGPDEPGPSDEADETLPDEPGPSEADETTREDQSMRDRVRERAGSVRERLTYSRDEDGNLPLTRREVLATAGWASLGAVAGGAVWAVYGDEISEFGRRGGAPGLTPTPTETAPTEFGTPTPNGGAAPGATPTETATPTASPTPELDLCLKGYRIHQSVAMDYDLPLETDPQTGEEEQLYANSAGQYGLLFKDADGDGMEEWYIGGVGGPQHPATEHFIGEDAVAEIIRDWHGGEIADGPTGVQSYC